MRYDARYLLKHVKRNFNIVDVPKLVQYFELVYNPVLS